MQKDNITRKLFESTHLMVLLSYSLFSIILIGETIIMKWELWAIPLIVISNIMSWIMHIRNSVPTKARTWIYAVLMMGTFFLLRNTSDQYIRYRGCYVRDTYTVYKI
ncbi:MAG: hypothetical protein IJK13_01940 [Lachnospiraceae bacterium]|nr:hypothetical protein [Lachnospiraceae bacterium]MBR0434751.1 hypothetical protein [Lachnospiraceae bacterium]